MKKIYLRGIAEGVAGASFVMAKSTEDVFLQIPALQELRHKIVIKDDIITGYAACDG